MENYDFNAGIESSKDLAARGGHSYRVGNDTLRKLGEPVKQKSNLPRGMFLSSYLDESGRCTFVNEDQVLEPWVTVAYTDEEHERWAQLFARIETMVPDFAVKDVVDGFEWLRGLGAADRIPSLSEINPDIRKASGFELVPVMGLLPDDLFFKLLMESKFPVTLSIRRRDEIGYTPFPDIFHDLAGHGTMFLNDRFSEFVRKIGAFGWQFRGQRELQKLVALLYWYTIEFGLKREANGKGPHLRVYGAGIISSCEETRASVAANCTPDDSRRPIIRLPFDLRRLLRSHYEFERSQELYFVIDDYRQLTDLFDESFEETLVALNRDMKSGRLSRIPQGRLLPEDRAIPV